VVDEYVAQTGDGEGVQVIAWLQVFQFIHVGWCGERGASSGWRRLMKADEAADSQRTEVVVA
jgi:hypothetical protein